jgi:hypothetical protein
VSIINNDRAKITGKGELVWFRVDPIHPPKESGLPTITHWPGLLAEIQLRVQSTPLASDSTATAGKEVAPGTRHHFDHHLRPLGMFSQSGEVIRKAGDILPWSIGSELLGGDVGWGAIGKDAQAVLQAGVAKEAADLLGKVTMPVAGDILTSRWKRYWAERVKFSAMPLGWQAAVVRMTVALKTSEVSVPHVTRRILNPWQSIIKSWTQTDKIDHIPDDAELSKEDLAAIETQQKTLYQV